MARSLALLALALVGPAQAWAPLSTRPLVRAPSRVVAVGSTSKPAEADPAAAEEDEPPKRTSAGTVLVSGFLDCKDRTDQFVFDMLHKNEVFEKIVAYSADTSFAKKRLTSRSARYTGLLDVLDFAEGTPEDLLKGADGPLDGVNSWLAFAVDAATLTKQAESAKAAGVQNLVLLCTTDSDFTEAEKILADSPVAFTFIRTGEIVDGPDDRNVIDVGALADGLEAGANITRNDAIRVAADSFILPQASNKAFTLFRGGEDAASYLKMLREAGFNRSTEIGAVIGGGKAEWLENKDKPKENDRDYTAEEIEAQRLADERWERAKIQRKKDRLEEKEKEIKRRIEIEFQLRFYEKRDLYGDADGCKYLEDYREKFFDSFAEDCKKRMFYNDAGELRVMDDDWEEERTRKLVNAGVDEREKMYAAQINKQLDKMKELDYVEE